MPTLRDFSISLSRPQWVYFAGDMIKGAVQLDLNSPLKMRNLRVKLVGRAETGWETERKADAKVPKAKADDAAAPAAEAAKTAATAKPILIKKEFQDEETYVVETKYLWGRADSEAEELEAGSHRFDFDFKLPPGLPSSFEGEHGNVRYFLKATCDRPWRWDHDAKAVFTVIGVQDLNLDHSASLPKQKSKTQSTGCCCFGGGQVEMLVKLPKQAFVPGQPIPVELDIANESQETVKAVEYEITQNIDYEAKASESRRADGSRRRVTEHKKEANLVLRQTEKVGLAAGESKDWTSRLLVLPACVDMLLACGLIDVSYELQVSVVLSGTCSSNVIVTLPFKVGTVPLESDFKSILAPSGPSSAPPPTLRQYRGLPSAVYVEAGTGKRSTREADEGDFVRGAADFAPLYPVYNFAKPA